MCVNDVIWGLVYGLLVSSAFLGAVVTVLYWLRVGETNETTYFRFIMLLVSFSALFITSGIGAYMILRCTTATIIPAAIVIVLGLITSVRIFIKERRR